MYEMKKKGRKFRNAERKKNKEGKKDRQKER